jgi:protein-tyrosine phosphatase
MIDLHCHILPQVDDGPTSLDESLAMARFCVADGITHIIATPHCHRFIHLLRETILPQVDRLNIQLFEAHIPLTVFPGSEIQVTSVAEYQKEFTLGRYCHLGDSSAFTLLEFNWDPQLFPHDAANLIRWIRDQGTVPILAHPERHFYFTQNLPQLDSLVKSGAWVQVTVDSLLGNHGPDPRTAGAHLLERYHEVVLATDAHNMIRCSGLSAGYRWITEHLGEKRCQDVYTRAEEVFKNCKVRSLGRPDEASPDQQEQALMAASRE